jgi:hypothetical protein
MKKIHFFLTMFDNGILLGLFWMVLGVKNLVNPKFCNGMKTQSALLIHTKKKGVKVLK